MAFSFRGTSAASGGYMLACAADEIILPMPTSIRRPPSA